MNRFYDFLWDRCLVSNISARHKKEGDILHGIISTEKALHPLGITITVELLPNYSVPWDLRTGLF